jgi:hypothetical protein
MRAMKRRIQIVTMSILLAAPAFAANPFLDAKDDKPVSANFKGTEWNDENIEGEIPLTARVVTTRIAQMPWGAIFKIEFTDLKSKAPEKREIRTDYYIATNDRIALFDASLYVQVESGTQTKEQVEKDNEAAIKKVAAMDKAPAFEENNIYGIATGRFKHKEGNWETTIAVKGDFCVYDAVHPSGHFRRIAWKKGAGLVQYDMGYGAMKDGFRLKRLPSKS